MGEGGILQMSHKQLKILVEISQIILQICAEKAVFLLYLLKKITKNTREITHIYKVFL